MRTTVTLDDELLARAARLTGITDRGALIRQALTCLVQRETSRRLVKLGGTMSDLERAPRRRPDVPADPDEIPDAATEPR